MIVRQDAQQFKAKTAFNNFAVKIANCIVVLGFMKSQTPSTKSQINYKFQYPMTKTCLKLSILG
ncbi:MAG: hypothetical protein DRG34_01335 [Deltaproteobacteria bacterium]|jgi:hypothetical protein|nr:MAG: hypothetical protein DRG34_01335 [Deltaproteobacteria bacterium]